MIEFNYEQLVGLLSAFLWPLFRLSAFVVTAPVLGHKNIPMPVKIGFCLVLTVVMGFSNPPIPDVPLTSWAGLALIFEQVLIGAALGFIMKIIVTTVQATGEYISLSMGLGFATFFSPDSNSNTLVVSRLLYMFTLLMFLAMNGHLVVIETLHYSFHYLPIGSMDTEMEGFRYIAKLGTVLFTSGLLMSLPVLVPLLCINISMGIMNRSTPQFTIFSIGFPMTMLVGLLLIIVLMRDLRSFLDGLFRDGFEAQAEFIRLMAGG